jgi:hypothetical protein
MMNFNTLSDRVRISEPRCPIGDITNTCLGDVLGARPGDVDVEAALVGSSDDDMTFPSQEEARLANTVHDTTSLDVPRVPSLVRHPHFDALSLGVDASTGADGTASRIDADGAGP